MIHFRLAHLPDAPDVATLHTHSWQQHYRGILSDHYLDHEVAKEHREIWHRRLDAPAANQIVTISLQDNELLGFSCLYLDHDPIFGSFLDNLHVRTSHHRAGIGKMLMLNCAHLILEKASSFKMYLWVFEKNTLARAVYEHLGSKHFETIENKEDGINARICRYTWDDVSSLNKIKVKM